VNRLLRGLFDPNDDGAAVSGHVRQHLAAALVVTCVTAWFSYAYFHPDEYFQIIELARQKLDPAAVPVLPWEHARGIRPWLQPFLYWLIGRGLQGIGVRDIFDLALVLRLVTGLTNIGALALFVRTTLPWQKTVDEKRLHVRVVTLLGFLPYLFVRTSSESGSMAALTVAWSLFLEGASPKEDGRLWSVPALERPGRVALVGLLFGIAFEMRFQTAFITFGVAAWAFVVGRCALRRLVPFVLGGAFALVLGALADRWGYGGWTFPPWGYFKVNVLEGVAAYYGRDPPFAYAWMLPANVFMPVVLALVVLALVAWLRCPRHPLTWATLPFFVVHNLIAHKEERFLFPIAIFAGAFVTMALGPSFGDSSDTRRLRWLRETLERVAAWGWQRRRRWPGKLLAGSSVAAMTLLAFVPLGWNHTVRFTRFLHDYFGDEVHATALPEIPSYLPAFHPRVYDVDRAEPEEVVRRIEAGTARPWLITEQPLFHASALDARATLVFSELPCYRNRALAEQTMRLVDAYNAHARPPLRQLRYRSLYRIDGAVSASGGGGSPRP
jgi:phosphatidylinositol glycan class B